MDLKIGDKVWVPAPEYKQCKVTCPVCYGKKRVTVILGNGDLVETNCNYCGAGYDGPNGFIMDQAYEPRAEQTTIVGVTVREIGGFDGRRDVEYLLQNGGYGGYVKPNDVYTNEKDATEAAARRAASFQDEEDKRRKSKKKDDIHRLTWNVGYHQREAREMKRKIKFHEERAVVLKKRNEEEKGK